MEVGAGRGGGALDLCVVNWPHVLPVSSGGTPVQKASKQEVVATWGNRVNSHELAGRHLIVLSTPTF